MSIGAETRIVGPLDNGALMTLEEFDSIADWDRNYVYELVNGVLIVSPQPSEQERSPNDYLGHLFLAYSERHPGGENFVYSLPEQTVQTLNARRRADRVVWVGLGRLPNVRRDTPAIAIEFVSPGLRNRVRDYNAKRAEYAEVGIGEYWIIDRFRRQMTVHRNLSTGQVEIVVHDGEIYSTSLLPGFELSIARIMARIDALRSAQDE
jgi:Uma2 family endonuclease